jgi:hypothetical protein
MEVWNAYAPLKYQAIFAVIPNVLPQKERSSMRLNYSLEC